MGVIKAKYSASNRNEYHVGKGGPVRGADNLVTFMCRLSRISGSLNLLESYGPAQACIAVDLLFAFPLHTSNTGHVASATMQLTAVYVEKVAYANKDKHTNGKQCCNVSTCTNPTKINSGKQYVENSFI